MQYRTNPLSNCLCHAIRTFSYELDSDWLSAYIKGIRWLTSHYLTVENDGN
jgi:hypothetical protein